MVSVGGFASSHSCSISQQNRPNSTNMTKKKKKRKSLPSSKHCCCISSPPKADGHTQNGLLQIPLEPPEMKEVKIWNNSLSACTSWSAPQREIFQCTYENPFWLAKFHSPDTRTRTLKSQQDGMNQQKQGCLCVCFQFEGGNDELVDLQQGAKQSISTLLFHQRQEKILIFLIKTLWF